MPAPKRQQGQSLSKHDEAIDDYIDSLEMRIAGLEWSMDEASDTAGKLYQMVGRLQPRLGGDGATCIRVMDALVALSEQLETASDRKAREARKRR